MKVKKNLLFLFFISLTTISRGQSDSDIVATVGDSPISVGELKYVYFKDLKDARKEKVSLPDFLDTYIVYRRKIEEALSQKIDTLPSVRNEYRSLMNQLEQSYLTDTIVVQNLAQIAYDRLAKNLKVQDIIIAFPPQKTIYPKDTLEAYEIAKKIRVDIKNNGANYDEIVYALSSLSSQKQGVVPRNYGWVGSLMLDPILEDQIYSLKKGEVTKEPFRSEAGYHILKIEDERPDIGVVNLSNILLAYPAGATPLQRDSINNLASQIYEKLEAGADYSKMQEEYSSEYLMNPKGYLGIFGVQRPLIKIFEDAITDVPIEGYSKPVQRESAVHILRVEDRIDRYTWNDIKKDIENTIQRNNRYDNFITEERIKNLSQKIKYKLNTKAYKVLEDLCQKADPLSIEFSSLVSNVSSETLLSVDKRNYTVDDFLFFLKKDTKNLEKYKLTTERLKIAINEFIYQILLEIKKQSLQKEYPELLFLSKEYYAGLLYYNLMSTEVWDKAQSSQNNLSKLFEENRGKYNWKDPRFEGLLIFTKNKKLKKDVQNFIKKNKTNPALNSLLNEKFNKNKEANVIIERGFWSKGENGFVDYLVYKIPTTKTLVDYPESFVEGQLIIAPRSFNDVRGLVVEDYQNLLEKELDEQLKIKYPVEINFQILNELDNKQE